MKPTNNRKAAQLAAGLLLALSVGVLPACQKAKMTSVPRHADAPDQPAAVPSQETPTVVQPTPSSPPTPTTVFPTPAGPRPTPQDDDIETNNNGPVMVFYNTPARPGNPVVVQPPVQIATDVKVSWFDSGHRPYNVLSVCHTSECATELQADTVVHPGVRTNKIDVLFVVDTSASLKAEMPKIAANISSFVHALPPQTDFRFAMLIGHGPGAVIHGESDWFGNLYVTDAPEDKPVINAGVLRAPGNRLTEDALAKWLEVKFLGGLKGEGVPADRTQNPRVQGEALLANLNQFLTRGIDANSAFPRVGHAALAIIFVADENDVCYDYSKPDLNGKYYTPRFKGDESKADRGGIRHNGVLRDAPEHETFVSNVCKANGRHVDAQLLSESIRALYPESQQAPVIVSGILYPDNNIPSDGGSFSKDNEMGLGYLDLIQEFSGEVASLAGNNFGADMAQLGRLSGFKMNGGINIIPLRSNGRPVSINSIDSIRVEVHIDGQVHHLNEDDFWPTKQHGMDAIMIDREALEALDIGQGDEIKIFYTLK